MPLWIVLAYILKHHEQSESIKSATTELDKDGKTGKNSDSKFDKKVSLANIGNYKEINGSPH